MCDSIMLMREVWRRGGDENWVDRSGRGLSMLLRVQFDLENLSNLFYRMGNEKIGQELGALEAKVREARGEIRSAEGQALKETEEMTRTVVKKKEES